MITKKDLQLGRSIRQLRNKAELTQAQLAEKAGISTTFIGYIEIGQRKPSLRVLNKIAAALKVKTKDLIPY